MDFDFSNILSHINTVFVLGTKPGVLPMTTAENAAQEQDLMTSQHAHGEKDRDSSVMRLKGQMIFVPESDSILFLCSPSVTNLDDLSRRGLFLSDIPLHDATRDLVLLSENFEAEYKLAQKLEILTEELQRTHRELEDEKKKTDR